MVDSVEVISMFCPSSSTPGIAETQSCARVDLGNTRLVHAEKSSDLLHRELFVVIEGHDETLPFGKAIDRLVQYPGDFLALETDMRIVAAVVGIVVDVVLGFVVMFQGKFK